MNDPQAQGHLAGKETGFIEKATHRYIAASKNWRQFVKEHPECMFSEQDRKAYMDAFITVCNPNKTVREIVGEYSLDRSTVLKAARRGAIPGNKSGDTWLVDVGSEAFKAWLTSRKRKLGGSPS